MNASIRKFTFFLISCILAGSALHAAEQDNWYLHKSFSGLSSANFGPGQIFVELNATDGNDRIYVADCTADKIQVFDFNGTKLFEITGNTKPSGVVVGDNGTIYCLAQSTLKSYNSSGSYIKTFTTSLSTLSGGRIYGDDTSGALAINPQNNHLYVLSGNSKKVFIYDQNGTQIKSFGSSGTAPGQLNYPKDLAILPSGEVIVADKSNFNYFDANGTFLFRSANGAKYNLAISQDNIIYASRTGSTTSRILNSDSSSILKSSNLPSVSSNRLTFSEDGDLFFSCQNGTVQIWKRAYRTKGLSVRNVIPQPAIRGISQRSGTNVIDLDFEIIDPDDANATVGILAAVDGQFNSPDAWIIPTTWVDGTGSKIGTPIATNQVHRVSWDVKGDWAEQTGTLKFEIFCKDARRTAPLDLHFLELPLPDGNVTISRSPVKDSDFSNYYKYLLSIQSPGVNLSSGEIKHIGGSVLMDSNLKVTPLGRDVYMNVVGYRWAKQAELSLAREASTSGSINTWTANRPVMPRNFPNRVNEYGFDTGTHGSRAWWVVKASSLAIPDFTFTPFDRNSSANHQFGRRLSLDGEKLIVGYGDSNQRKLEYYNVSSIDGNLTYHTQIVPDSTANNQAKAFGNSFALDGNRLIVGAKDAYWNSMNYAGAAYLFDFNGSSFSQFARLSASDMAGSDAFGCSVDVSGNLIVSGAIGADISGNQNSGAAYLFRIESNGTITELFKLSHEDPKGDDYFGEHVAISGDIIAVAAPKDDILASGSNRQDAGSVTLFKVDGANNITRTAILSAPNPDSSRLFGSAIALAGNFLVVGEYRRNAPHHYSGRVYLYKISPSGTANLVATLDSPNPKYEGYFGFSVDLKGDRLAVGAYRENSETADSTGVAYLYQVKSDGSVTLLEVLSQPAGKSADNMGVSVSIAGRNTVVGANGFDLPPDKWQAGGAFLFRSSF